eukprot:TRINITY_DN21871_c0_g2_i2.p1 TRINITY_DN21871_c0_g2~~TRINITY_DN21871_c0_g2_i2.p1  ORF type:complete len:355 (+),score=40.29 TRINITY_DN21871_c0_g2_i2:42-1106(+)
MAFDSGSLPEWGGSLPPGSFVVLRGREAKQSEQYLAEPEENREPLSVLLLHGWLQCHQAWMGLAQQLRDQHGADVLLLDFYAHGRSPRLPKVQMHNVSVFLAQVRRVVEHVGWQKRRLVVGGMSLGASVALRYAGRYPDMVAGLLLITPSGMPEHLVSLVTAGRNIAKVLLGADQDPTASTQPIPATRGMAAKPPLQHASHAAAAGELLELKLHPGFDLLPLAHRWLARLNLIKRTPQYDVSTSDFAAARAGKWPVTIVVGRYDIIHTPHVADWHRELPQARILVTSATHWWLCTCVETLGLEDDPLWSRARLGTTSSEVSRTQEEGVSSLFSVRPAPSPRVISATDAPTRSRL